MTTQLRLSSIRSRIDEIDEKIQELVTERARWALQIAEIKQEAGEDIQFFCPEREAEVLEHVRFRNKGPAENANLEQVFTEIISTCRALQNNFTIAYLGPEGTYTQEATFKHFGHAINASPCKTITDIFHAVEAGDAAYGVVPIENSTEGGVNSTLDCFIQSPLQICSEIEISIHHCLLSNCENLSNIKTIYSHPQSFAQCRNWLSANLPHAKQICVSSNGQAAIESSKDSSSAAIASESAAEHYKLPIIHKNIENDLNNKTRFIVIAKHASKPSNQNKTSLLIKGRNKPGALYDALTPFKKARINLSRIESRPSPDKQWDYIFFIDTDSHIQAEKMQKVLEQLDELGSTIKILGSYPKNSGA